MKTLNEVIDIFEKVVKHDYTWFDEKTALMTIETLTDTLQYLRKYQKLCKGRFYIPDSYTTPKLGDKNR